MKLYPMVRRAVKYKASYAVFAGTFDFTLNFQITHGNHRWIGFVLLGLIPLPFDGYALYVHNL